MASIEDGSANVHLIYHRHTTNVVRGFVNSTADSDLGTASVNTIQRAAYRFEANNGDGAFNGVVGGAADSSVTLHTVDRLYLGRRSVGSPVSGYVRRLALYPRGMTDAQLPGLAA